MSAGASSASVSVRALSRDDLVRVQALAAIATLEGFRFVERFASDYPGIELDSPQQFFLGVFDGDLLVAIGGVTPDPYSDDSAIGRIRRVFVSQEYRGAGLGARLIHALEERAASVYPKIRLNTDTDAAAAFYERIGYARISGPSATHAKG